MKQPIIILGLIVCFALFLRLIYLGVFPAGFTPDEASQAYSAYSLLKTGRDEWGIPWPTSSFKSFLDYKAPLQTYLMLPSIALFGLNEFAARLPSALFGTLAIIAIYFLTNQLFGLRKFKIAHRDFNLGHLAAFFLAISPWHLQFSRTALEVNLTSFLFPMGLYFFLVGLENTHSPARTKYFVYTAILWSLGLYSYHAAKIFIPLFFLVLIIIYRRQLIKTNLKNYFLPTLVAIVLCAPLFFGLVFGQAGKRGSDLLVTTLSKEETINIDNQSFYSKLNRISPKLPRLFHNPLVFSVSKFTENYLSYFSPSFWFTEGGREITYSVIPGRGLLYFWMLPLIALAIFQIVIDKRNRSFLKIILPWLILAALPAALTKEGYRPNRAGSFALLWEMLAAFGLWSVLNAGFKYKKYLISAYALISVILIIFYFEDYAFGSFVKYPTALSYGWREAISFVQGVEGKYNTVLVEQGNQPQSFVAFYLKYDPVKFQQASSEWDSQISSKSDIKYLDQLGKYQLGKFRFEALNWPEDINNQTLYISKPNSLLPAHRHILHKVEVPNGVVFEIFDFKK